MECSKEVRRETATREGGSMLRRASGRERLAGGSAGEIRRGRMIANGWKWASPAADRSCASSCAD